MISEIYLARVLITKGDIACGNSILDRGGGFYQTRIAPLYLNWFVTFVIEVKGRSIHHY